VSWTERLQTKRKRKTLTKRISSSGCHNPCLIRAHPGQRQFMVWFALQRTGNDRRSSCSSVVIQSPGIVSCSFLELVFALKIICFFCRCCWWIAEEQAIISDALQQRDTTLVYAHKLIRRSIRCLENMKERWTISKSRRCT